MRKLAGELECDPSFLSKILAGKRSPPRDEDFLRKLAELLELDAMLLIVSTGMIPSELQDLMEDAEFLKSISGGTWFQKPIPARTHSVYHPKDLSEDLL